MKSLNFHVKTAKLKKTWKFDFDQIGYNYRMPNINAAIGCSQLNKLKEILRKKRYLIPKRSYQVYVISSIDQKLTLHSQI